MAVEVFFLCFCQLVASSGLFKLSVSPLPFKRSICRLSLRPATPISDHPKFHIFLYADHTTDHTTPKISAFSYFWPFLDRTDLARRKNMAVSVSNASSLPRNSFSALTFDRKRISDTTFWQFSLSVFLGVARRATQLRKLLAFSQPR